MSFHVHFDETFGLWGPGQETLSVFPLGPSGGFLFFGLFFFVAYPSGPFLTRAIAVSLCPGLCFPLLCKDMNACIGPIF